jgi:1A family penicillin-binding protein
MKRQGRYTKRQSSLTRGRAFIKRNWRAFKKMSRRKKILVVATPIVAFLVLTPIITYLVLLRDISDPERLMNRNNTGVQFVDKNDQVFFSTGSNKALKRLKLEEISDYTEKALIASEDKEFYEHEGFSIKGILGAVYNHLTGAAGGGSTLTQQLVKNTLLSTDQSFLRKYQELFMAIAVEQQYTKDEILDMYLNSVHYGEGAFGIDEAARIYFNKPASDLDLAESAMLIGILPAPSIYSPINGDPKLAKQRQTYVLKRMVEDGKITDAERDAALAEQLTYAEVKPVEYPHAAHFTEMVLNELYKKYGEEQVKRSGFHIKTTLDLNWQKQAEQIVKDRIALSAAGGGRNAALVAIDPKTGGVRSLIGSVDYNEPTFGKVNMATTARQPGSSMKPIYYTEAINQKLITAATILDDSAKDFGGYKPNNFDFRFRGKISVRNALPQSLNIPAVEVMQKLGVDEAVKKAREMGLSTIKEDGDYGLALALGAAEVKPLEMTNAYAAFADGGRQHDTYLIDTIQNKYGETIFRHESKSKRVQSSEASFIISDILSDNAARAPTFGSRLNIPGRKVAVKTGSTDDNRDAWTVGYTPSVAVGVWVGNNENEVMTSGGSAMAGPIWSQSIQAFLKDVPAESFIQPGTVVRSPACTAGGGSYEEYFMPGTVPSQTCVKKEEPKQEEPPKEEETNQNNGNQQQNKDTDGDGVKDDKDKCPATPAGSEVDKDGCPVVDEEPLDSDGDGVTDDKDKCPNTPINTQVNQQGCPIGNPPNQQGVLIPLLRRNS